MEFNIEKVRGSFPILQRRIKGYPLVYLDNAATALKPVNVAKTVEQHYALESANVHRGVHELSEEATQRFEAVRHKIRAFINAASSDEIIFTSGTTAAINLVSQSWGRKNIAPGDEIIVSQLEHHSNIVPWQMLCAEKGAVLKVLPINDAGEVIISELKTLLTPKTKLVAVTHVSNAIGTIVPVEEITAMAHANGSLVLLDGAQAMAHLPVDVRALGCDFYAFSGHKICGTTGTGVLYGKRAILESMPPAVGGGAMIEQVTFEKSSYAPLPQRLEAGTPNVAGVIGLGAAIDFLQNLGMERIKEYEDSLVAYGLSELKKIEGLRLVGSTAQRSAIFSFILEGVHPHDVGTLLDERGVAIRAGHHCSQPLMKRLGVPATSRASLAFYNTKEDIDVLCSAIRETLGVFH